MGRLVLERDPRAGLRNESTRTSEVCRRPNCWGTQPWRLGPWLLSGRPWRLSGLEVVEWIRSQIMGGG